MDDGDFVGDSDDEREQEEVSLVFSPERFVSTGEMTVVDEDSDVKSINPTANQAVAVDDPQQQEVNFPSLDSSEKPTEANVVVDESSTISNHVEMVDNGAVSELKARSDVMESSSGNMVDEQPTPVAVDPVLGMKPIEVSTQPHVREIEEAPEDPGPRTKFKVGDIVHVAARTWPGINKLGGAGKVASILTDTSDDGNVLFLYNVKYMLGGFEKRIEEEFIQYLNEALETGVRQHKERVFYHDEYLNEPHKRKKAAEAEAATAKLSHTGQDISSTDTRSDGAPLPSKKRKEKKVESRERPVLMDAPDIEFHARSSDDSDYDESDTPRDDALGDDHLLAQRLNDSSFILDERRIAASQRKRNQERSKKSRSSSRDPNQRKAKDNRPERQSGQEVESRQRKKRSRLVIESDESQDDDAEVNASAQRGMHHRSRDKKRRYIGGYEHGSGDADGSFIQPEGNPAELPDDIAKELQFQLGTTKAELRAQLETVADRLLGHLGEFEKSKTEVAKRLEQSASLDDVDLQHVNQQLLELGEFVRTKFIRSGEDVMNLIIKMLEKKGARLPDRIDLQFEDWKQRVAEHDAWVKQSLRALGAMFDRRGFGGAFVDETPHEDSPTESDSSSEATNSGQDDFDILNSDSPSMATGTTGTPSSFEFSRSRRYSRKRIDHDKTNISSPANTRRLSKKRPRNPLKTQSSMDAYAVPVSDVLSDEQFRSRNSRQTQSSLDAFAVPVGELAREELFRSSRFTSSNFRFVRGRDASKLKDPRWDWARILHQNHSSVKSSTRSRAAPSSHGKAGFESTSKKRRSSESVMEAVLRLRDKRYRDRSMKQPSPSQPRVIQSSYVLPPVNQTSTHANRPSLPIEQRQPKSHKVTSSTTLENGPMITIKQEPRKWENIFNVLSAEENIPNLHTGVTTGYASLGAIVQDTEITEDRDSSSFDEPLTAKTIPQEMAKIRQDLNTLRAAERAEVDAILRERSPSSDRDSWLRLSALSDDLHSRLLTLVGSLCRSLRSIHPSDLTAFLESTVSELSFLLKQIPDCATMFGDSPSYAYFFEVASPEARQTPLITTICRAYWYSIQLLTLLKKTCESSWLGSKQEWEPIIARSLSPNRVAVASCLFLIDLYIHIPSTHRFAAKTNISDECTQTEIPALALWEFLNEVFSSGTIQSNKEGEISSLWHLLQAAYKQGLVDLVGIGFIKGESFGGYIQERAPRIVQESDEDIQGKLLAADILWDLSCLLGSLFHSAVKSNQPISSSSWNLVRQLLSTNQIGFLPVTDLPRSDALDEELQLQAHGFKLRVLRRLLVLSAIWPPESDTLEKLFPHLWDSVLEDEDQAALSSVVDFIGEVRQLEDKKNDAQRYALARQHAATTTNSVELFCKIALMQLCRLEKTIHRVRYRQPVLRAIFSHIEKHRITLAAAYKRTEDTSGTLAKTDGLTKSWNWTKRGDRSGSEQSVKPKIPEHSKPLEATPKEVVGEINSVLAIVLMFGLATLYLDEESAGSQQSARRKRDLKREIDFLCKELSSVSCDVSDTSTRLCECLLAVGTASLGIGTSFSTPFEHIDDVMKWTAEKLLRARQNDANKPGGGISDEVKRLQATATSCLRAMRDLSAQLIEQLQTSPNEEAEEVESCMSAALGGGLAAMIDAVVDGSLSLLDLDLEIELMMLWMPICDINPTHSLQFAPSTILNPSDEFDEFDDPEMMDLLATVDLESATTGTKNSVGYIRELQDRARAFSIGNLRLPIQKLVVSFPQRRWRTYQELYLIDLMGSMVSSSKFPFSWTTVSLTSLKPRMLAPRLMGSILKHTCESDWFSTCFLSEQNADGELSTMWITATLDLQSLFPTVSVLRSITSSDTKQPSKETTSVKYSSYWLSLTDAILARLLKDDPVVRYKMDQLMFRLLCDTARNCSYGSFIRESSDPSDVRTLYTMHADVFRAFCQSAGNIWQSLCGDPILHRQDMNRFRTKMMDTQRGVFVTLPEAYEINLRTVCQELDRKSVSWYSLSGRLLDDFSARNGSISLHTVDDATSMLDRELSDAVIRPLIILFKFMYDCVDSFLFNCGGMAIGQQNIFYSIIELMFRQARCAEFPTAERRLKLTSATNSAGMKAIKPSIATSLAGVSPACVGFTESVRLFFAYQKYPSLLNWFAQNLDTYQTLKAGWMTSPLRVLLYNVFDPDGPLGVHSYYPMQEDLRKDAQFDVRSIRREAFYLVCGLLHCRCTTSYEHTRCAVQPDQEVRRSQLRRFILTSFVTELCNAVANDDENMDESILPYFQVVKAFLNHLTLDGGANIGDLTPEDLVNVEQDMIPCLVKIFHYATQKLCEKDPINEAISCVVLIEFFCIVEELYRVNITRRDERIHRFLDLGLRCAAFTYSALSRFSSSPLEQLFSDECLIGFNVDDLTKELNALSPGANHDVKPEHVNPIQSRTEDYGIGKVRVRSDLLTVVRRLVRTCSKLECHPLLVRQGDTSDHAAAPSHEVLMTQVSVEGTM